jgi:hypothetical protein
MTYDVGFQMTNSDNNDFVGNTIRDSQRCIQIDYSSARAHQIGSKVKLLKLPSFKAERIITQ